MRKIITVLGILIVAGIVAIPPIMGSKLEEKYQKYLTGISQPGLIEYKISNYRTGWFHSNFTLTMVIIDPNLNQMLIDANKEINIHGEIDHGPIVHMQDEHGNQHWTFGFGLAHQDIEFGGKIAGIMNMIDVHPNIHGDVLFKFDGSYHDVMVIDAIHFSSRRGHRVDWEGLSADKKMSADISKSDINMNFGSITVNSGDLNIHSASLIMQGELTRDNKTQHWVGPFAGTLPSIIATLGNVEIYNSQNLSLKDMMLKDGENDFNISLDSLKVKHQNNTDAANLQGFSFDENVNPFDPDGITVKHLGLHINSYRMGMKGLSDLTLDNFAIENDLTVNNSNLDAQLKLALDKAAFLQQSYGPIQFTLNINNLDVAASSSLITMLKELGRHKSSPQQTMEFLTQHLDLYKKLFSKGVVLSVQTNSQLPQGKMDGKLVVRFATADNSQAIADLTQVILNSEVELNLALSAELTKLAFTNFNGNHLVNEQINTIAGSESVKSPQEQIDMLVQKGYLTLQEGNYQINVTYKDHKLKINNIEIPLTKPAPPAVAAPAAAPAPAQQTTTPAASQPEPKSDSWVEHENDNSPQNDQ